MRYLLLLLIFYARPSTGQPAFADSLIKKGSLRETLFFLSQDSLRGRLTGSKGADMAAKFIAARFDSMGLKPVNGNDGYFDMFPVAGSKQKIQGKNVVGSISGTFANDTVIIFSAHYDHLGEKDDLPFNKDFSYRDDIFNGANDNATGIAALLELAKYYKAQNNNRYQLLFIAFSGEEMGMLGSGYLIKKSNLRAIKAVINLEMLGRPVAENCFIISSRNNVIRKILNNYLKNYQHPSEKVFFSNDPYPDENLSNRSDHAPFARKIKNAFTIMASSPTDTYYHSVDDEYETIDLDFLLTATRKIALACEYFIR